MNLSFRQLKQIAGWVVFGVAMFVYYYSAERSGSLWDCGEFILGAYKLQVVHPPGAPMFLVVGRLFAWIAEIFSDNPATIAFAVNLMSSICTAGAAMFIAWSTMLLGKLSFVSRSEELESTEGLLLAGAGIVAGLATAFCSSIWFSAVEGEVYAMSTFFTTMTLWATLKWYTLSEAPDNDRWLIFAIYSAGLSVGVHLLSILIFPALALFYYFKKYDKVTPVGVIAALGLGVVSITVLQKLIITGIPYVWSQFELLTVNSIGLPFHSGLIPTLLLVVGVLYFGFRYAYRKQKQLLQSIMVALTMLVVSYSTIGVVLIRANANTPVNMNEPSDAHRLLPYLNREQYGERPLLRGPHFTADPVSTNSKEKYGQVGDRYEVVDYSFSAEYRNSDKVFFPRLGHMDDNRKRLYQIWLDLKPNEEPSMADNLEFFFRYQIGWMYVRYFMWNFTGRQNGDQGYFPWDVSKGNWYSGISFIDSGRLYSESKLPDSMRNNEARNKYFMLPFLFGLLGLIFHARNNPKDFFGVFALFIITGLGIIVYSNQPPNEPRERDYVLVGSFFTYCIWIGFGCLAIFSWIRQNMNKNMAAGVAVALVLTAPILMGFQNFDDHSRRHLTGARDYASNFLESCEPNAIIFTYGDNDTYPLWYAQEVEGIRTDVRVINLSLISVDWYVNQMRRRINESPAIKLTVPAEAYRGYKRNYVQLYGTEADQNRRMTLQNAIKFVGEHHPIGTRGGREIQSYLPSKNLFIPVDRAQALASGWAEESDSARIINNIPIKIGGSAITKGDLAVLDIISSNIYDRPIYFAVTVLESKMFGMDDYLKLDGLALRIMPTKSKSDNNFGTVGNGSIDSDRIYDLVMNKFKWGGFDKHDQFVTSSFFPSYYTHKNMINRAAFDLLQRGENQKAMDLVSKYFEVFPHNNFTYDSSILNLLRVYDLGGGLDQAKETIRTLATETSQQMEFYASLSPSDKESFRQKNEGYKICVNEIIRLANKMGDEEFKQEMNTLVGQHQVEQVKG